jgi:tetratricopeptide (TPR) repeat protein
VILLESPQLAEDYGLALQAWPDDAQAQDHLGTALAEQGKTVEAIDRFEAALRIRPDYAEAHDNLGVLSWPAKAGSMRPSAITSWRSDPGPTMPRLRPTVGDRSSRLLKKPLRG